jgi:hypothetical protein
MNKYTELDRFAAQVQSHVTRPNEIIGAPWPSLVPGAMRWNCKECSAYVSLSPATGLKMHERFPLVPIICRECFIKKAD